MEKVWRLLTLEGLKGSRSKLSLVAYGVAKLLVYVGVVAGATVDTVTALLTPFFLYFLLEHYESLKK